jgi:predicted restriction endonuclease
MNLTNTQIQLAEQLLLTVIRREKVVEYNEIAQRINPPIHCRQVGREIGEVSKLCKELGLPLLSAKVVSKGSGTAGEGFYPLYSLLGLDTEGKSEKELFSQELKKIRECKEWYKLADHLGLDLDLPRPLDSENDTAKTELISGDDKKIVAASFIESEIEDFINQKDVSAKRVKKHREVLERVCNTAIPDGLKKLYSYRCQICGLGAGDTYGYSIVEAHHIVPFSESMNNDASNIIILCPNHHRLMHKANPIFDRKNKTFMYSDGHNEGLKYNSHL